MVRRHEVLGESDVAVEVRELTGLRGQPLRTREELSGRRASRPAPAGSIVAADWMEPAPEVRRGELVTVVARVGGIWASTQATALAEGRTGDTIAVRKLAAAGAPRIESEFLARVCGPGRAEVVLSP
jgi:flagella basal body P-ring formation protein FlgA